MGEVVYVALGSNLSDRARYLEAARLALAALPHTRVLAESPVEETEPFGPPGQGAYLNQMIALDTELEPRALLEALQAIEAGAGRVRAQHWGPRTLDLDIVRFGQRTISDAQLHIPHPGFAERNFWQREAAFLDEALDG